jgi:uncharacterized UPF0146 family protein
VTKELQGGVGKGFLGIGVARRVPSRLAKQGIAVGVEDIEERI